jgi:hypothetical protein
MAQNSRFLLLICTTGHPEKGKISICKLRFFGIAGCGKKPGFSERGKKPQYVEVNVKLTEMPIFTKFLPK